MAFTGTKRDTHINSFSHRVILCSMEDVIDDSGTMRLSRKVALPAQWAAVQPTKPNFFSTKPSFFSVEGRGIIDAADKPTHTISMRPRYDVDVSSAAWVYEERMRSAPRWYKVIGMSAEEDELQLTVRLVERSDALTRPVVAVPDGITPGVTTLTPLPKGVVL